MLLRSGVSRFNSQNLCLLHCAQSDSGANAVSFATVWARSSGTFRFVRRSAREADHSSLSAAYVSVCGCISSLILKV